jgi:predicted acetyltransferase
MRTNSGPNTREALEIRPLVETHAEEATRQRAIAFGANVDEEAIERTRRRIAEGELWGAFEGSRLLAHCGLSPHDHWFGGRLVTCQHVASVAVPPENRGHGVASGMMRAAVDHGRAEGLGLSLLFPATTRLYRKLGWEHAGWYTRYRLAAWQATPAGDRPPAMRPATDRDWDGIRECYTRAAARSAGVAVRPDWVWERLGRTAFHYVLDGPAPGTIDAYALYDHTRTPDDWRFTIEIGDWAAATPPGLRAVVGHVASHGSLGKDATFQAGSPEPWSMLVGEQDVTLEDSMYWMARGLDLGRAVEQRGFPPGLTASVTVAIDDPLLPQAAGSWRLELKDGRGTLTPASTADVRLDPRAVGPIFTGFRSPAQLALAGLVEGAPDALGVLAAAFAGPPPTLLDFF